MTAQTSTKYDEMQNDGIRKVWVELPATTFTADTTTVDLANYGATALKGILGFAETTAGSVVVQEQPTTSLSSTTLTITVGGSSVTAKRNYEIFIK